VISGLKCSAAQYMAAVKVTTGSCSSSGQRVLGACAGIPRCLDSGALFCQFILQIGGWVGFMCSCVSVQVCCLSLRVSSSCCMCKHVQAVCCKQTAMNALLPATKQTARVCHEDLETFIALHRGRKCVLLPYFTCAVHHCVWPDAGVVCKQKSNGC
jgi:hypothetical protein